MTLRALPSGLPRTSPRRRAAAGHAQGPASEILYLATRRLAFLAACRSAASGDVAGCRLPLAAPPLCPLSPRARRRLRPMREGGAGEQYAAPGGKGDAARAPPAPPPLLPNGGRLRAGAAGPRGRGTGSRGPGAVATAGILAGGPSLAA